jgi:hypothetical protein
MRTGKSTQLGETRDSDSVQRQIACYPCFTAARRPAWDYGRSSNPELLEELGQHSRRVGDRSEVAGRLEGPDHFVSEI